jgi:hypothetical protein
LEQEHCASGQCGRLTEGKFIKKRGECQENNKKYYVVVIEQVYIRNWLEKEEAHTFLPILISLECIFAHIRLVLLKNLDIKFS